MANNSETVEEVCGELKEVANGNNVNDDGLVVGFIGFVIGLVAMLIPCVRTTTPNSTLHEVGIERIAYCCNAHSNWYEIVWKEGCR